MLSDTKSLASAILGRKETPPPTEGGEASSLTEDPGLDACADECMSALAAKDKPAFIAAMKSMFQLLETQPHAEDE